ncbi:hypothetical protein [Clostridium fessum]|jgi:hypothetical protein|uniref:hypothetical protein n=1 Tax=Clostridium fessum TaxID=2126740 RepID=UPI0020704E15|nr:MAG TPA: DNA repair protein-like protein [Caudoviricetes sp.]
MQKLSFRTLKAAEIDCRISTVSQKGISLLLYKDARVDQNILDETVGPMNWQRSHSRDNANCTVSLWDDEKQQWISKEDTGTESNTEKEKGLASDSFKRACFNWGIGRELYTAPFIWIAVGDCKVVDSGRTDKYGKPVFTCYDKFKVSRIGYDTDRNIIDLVIVDKKGKAVFSISRVDENGNKPDDPPALEEKYVNSLFLELKRTGVGLSSLLKSFNVSDVHELRFEQWKSAMDQLKTKPDKA